MARVPLTGGAYQARSLIANAQRCVNLYPEKNAEGDQPPVPVTHYLTEGLRPLLVDVTNAAPVRGLWLASSGDLYAVIGLKCYFVNTNFGLTEIGTFTSVRNTPVSMVDNGSTLMIGDGSTTGYKVNLTTRAFSAIVDSSGTFVGADKVDFIDTFTLFNFPGTRSFGSTESATTNPGLTFNGLYQQVKGTWPDLLVTLAVLHREIWLLGSQKSEVWFNAGNPVFPFAVQPGAYIEHGCAARYSAASSDVNLYWVGSDLQGQGVIFKGSPYTAKRISTHAIEQAIQQYPQISDAIGFTYQVNGHNFYVVNFPSGNATWVYDESTEQWHERQSINAQSGALGRWRANCFVSAYGKNIVGDFENGQLYWLDQNCFTENAVAIPRIRSFPHLMNDAKRVSYPAFIADMECGLVAAVKDARGVAIPPQVYLRWSDDRGKTYGNAVGRSLGETGKYQTFPTWRRTGRARDRVFELSWSIAGKTALNGAFIDGRVGKS